MYNILIDYLEGSLSPNALYLKLARMYLKYFYPTREARSVRMIFQGRRLKAKHNEWLHFSNHPHEVEIKAKD